MGELKTVSIYLIKLRSVVFKDVIKKTTYDK